MSKRLGNGYAPWIIASLLLSARGYAAIQVCDPGPPHNCVAGTDGALDLSSSFAVCQGGALAGGVCTIDLGAAGAATWNVAGPTPGHGVYDGARWAVVFKFTSVNVPSNVTVKFLNNASRAPVVWLVSGNVTIDGTVNLSGADAVRGSVAEPGPGGFRGAKSNASGGAPGLGPGGGANSLHAYAGSFGVLADSIGGDPAPGPTYGSPRLLPLLGGSGGAANQSGPGAGGAGGGAILIAANGTVNVNGTIFALGGVEVTTAGRGSGGGIRIVADQIGGVGLLRATASGTGSNGGRIRLDANAATLGDTTGVTQPLHTSGSPCTPPGGPGCVAEIWPDDLAPVPPEVRVASVGGQSVPADPKAQLVYPLQDIRLASAGPVTVMIETRNVPSNWNVKARVTPLQGDYVEVLATDQGASSNPGWELWSASVTLPNRFSAVQVRASAP